MAELAGIVFDQKGVIPGSEVLLGSYAFAFQIFGDFAGYSFIAMGIARLLGFELMTNFLYPYFVTNPRDFWRHWHISLSLWLRDYLYIPLGGSRNGEFKTYRNLMLTMLLGGLWHGAAWTFVIWGSYQGFLLCVHRWMTRAKDGSSERSLGWIYVLKVVGMFQLTCLGWLIFRAKSFDHLCDLLKSLFFNFTAYSMKLPYLAGQIVFFTWLVLLIQYFQKNKGSVMLFADFTSLRPWILFAVMFYLFVLFGEFGGQEFIYFQF
ncbi:MAG: MBOAT family protein [Candidatus Omnitrophica bacterium]|nr:MBOAT family protein [Candidatus Omnitrophota bacterium]